MTSISSTTFESFNFNPALLKSINDSGYSSPTPIQSATIPIVLSGRDLMGCAQTGTGKTAAFILPILQKIASEKKSGRGPRVLVLAPTRELAMQVKDAASKYAKHLRSLKIISIIGGASYSVQHKQLSQTVDLLIATPGRLIDHLESGRVDLSNLEMLILDEADRMLDMGFLEDVEYIASATPESRQTLMFSATFDKSITKLAQRLLKKPEHVNITQQKSQHKQIEQRLHYANSQTHKERILLDSLSSSAVELAIIFTGTKRSADELTETIRESGFEAAALHGDMPQRKRIRTLDKMRQGELRILVATDVAARGIDVTGISHVFNYDLPRTGEDYVHRIGRTGRAGATGTAISFVIPKERQLLKRIEQFIGHEIVLADSSSAPSSKFQRDPKPTANQNDRVSKRTQDIKARKKSKPEFKNKFVDKRANKEHGNFSRKTNFNDRNYNRQESFGDIQEKRKFNNGRPFRKITDKSKNSSTDYKFDTQINNERKRKGFNTSQAAGGYTERKYGGDFKGSSQEPNGRRRNTNMNKKTQKDQSRTEFNGHARANNKKSDKAYRFKGDNENNKRTSTNKKRYENHKSNNKNDKIDKDKSGLWSFLFE